MKTFFRSFGSLALISCAALALTACEQKAEQRTPESTTSQEELSATELISNPNTANPQEVPVPNDLGVMTFKEREYDFGQIHQGQVVTHTFEFENTGKKPVIIDNASSSCGCTVPSYPREPVPPGGKGALTVKFDSHGKNGLVQKIVVVRANTQPNIAEVIIKADVLVP